MPKLSWEALVGIVLEIVVEILNELHVREPVIVWGLFIVGLVLLLDAIVRSNWRKRRKFIGVVAMLAVGFGFGLLINAREKAEATVNESNPALPESATVSPAVPRPDLGTSRKPHRGAVPTKKSQPVVQENIGGQHNTNTEIGTAQGPVAVAPNGIANAAPNLGTQTVTNTFADAYPRPGLTPTVSFCVSPTQIAGDRYETRIAITTDIQITAPFWVLIFDTPVDEHATLSIDGITEPFGMMIGHPQTAALPLGTLPPDASSLLVDSAKSFVPESDEMLRVQITEIGPPFGGPYRPWGPNDRVELTVRSKQKAHLLAVASGYGRSFLTEHMNFVCAPSHTSSNTSTSPTGSIVNEQSSNYGTQTVNNYATPAPPKLAVPDVTLVTRQGLMISDFPNLTISAAMMEHLRRQSLTVRNPNRAELWTVVLRFQLPEPVVGRMVIESKPAGVEITWNACRMGLSVIGNGASASPVPGGGFVISTAPKAGASATAVGGSEVCSPDMNNRRLSPTGIYQLQIDRMPALTPIRLAFLTSDDPESFYLHTARHTNRSSYCGRGTYQFVSEGRTETFSIFVGLSFDPASRTITSMPPSTTGTCDEILSSWNLGKTQPIQVAGGWEIARCPGACFRAR